MGAPRQYPGTVVRVVDADTVNLVVDLGFGVDMRLSCRLAGINAIELSDPGGEEGRAFLAGLLPVGAVVPVLSVAVDKFANRFDGKITLPDGRDAATVVVDAGFAVWWNGKGKKPAPPWPPPGQAA